MLGQEFFVVCTAAERLLAAMLTLASGNEMPILQDVNMKYPSYTWTHVLCVKILRSICVHRCIHRWNLVEHFIFLSYPNTLTLCTTDLTQITCLGRQSPGPYTACTHTRTHTHCSYSMVVECWRSAESLWRRTIPSTIIYRSSAGHLSINHGLKSAS